MTLFTFLCVCVCVFKGFGGIQMPGEEYDHVSAGGSEWEGVSDAEAAVVFNQRTGVTLQLPAEQGVWEVNIRKTIVIYRAISRGTAGGSHTEGIYEVSLFSSVGRRDSLEFCLLSCPPTTASFSSSVGIDLYFIFIGPRTVQMFIF